jgi:hypothetical protein
MSRSTDVQQVLVDTKAVKARALRAIRNSILLQMELEKSLRALKSSIEQSRSLRSEHHKESLGKRKVQQRV